MSDLVPSVITLDKGLNLQVPKIVAAPGSVLDTINYEQVDFQGQKRIDGYTRFDGHTIPDMDDYFVLEIDQGPDGTLESGDLIGHDGKLTGFVLDVTDDLASIKVIDYNNLPEIGEFINAVEITEDGVNFGDDITVTNKYWGRDTLELTPDDHYTNLLTYNDIVRALVGRLPGQVAGLHWFRDRLYAVAGLVGYLISDSDEDLHPTDIVVDDNGDEAEVLVAFTINDVQYIYVNPTIAGTWTDSQTIFHNDDLVGDVLGRAPEYTASFFEARTELITVAELEETLDPHVGWKFIPLGWVVNFENGESLFGSLPSLNQHIQGIGIQGPTDTSGSNGRPLQLSQSVEIDGQNNQINGWKSSVTPLTYNLDPDDVADEDSVYTYADAYITWNGTTGSVQAPGYTTLPLTEYPATNAVVVEIL